MNTPPPADFNGHAEPFLSLASLKEAHTALLKMQREGEHDGLLDAVEQFLRRGAATGVYLDGYDDRVASQSLLDYWVPLLYKSRRTPPDATLEEFDPNLAPELDDELCPYRGLNAFQELDRDIFFGRQRLIDSLVEKAGQTRLLFVIGPSGSGKSSLVLAGLIPALKSGAIKGSEGWRYVTRMLPGSNPLKNLALALDPQEADLKQQAELFKGDARHLLKRLGDDRPAVVMVDQFEEIYTLCADNAVREAFIKNLVEAASAGGARHTVIITLRTDYESYIAGSDALLPFYEAGPVRPTPPSAKDLYEAIEKPAARIGLKFEAGVVDALVKDILGEPAGLPLLQFTLLQLWKMRENKRNRVTMKSYRSLGDARRALALTAEEFFQHLPEAKKQTVKRILLRLVKPSEGLEVTSSRVKRKTLHKTGEAAYRVDEVIEALRNEGLVRLTEGETRADDQVEVAHEALIQNWPRLLDWLESERASLRQRFRLSTAAQQWLEYGESALLSGALLEQALSYDDLNEFEDQFVKASVAAAEAAENEKREAERREKELEREKLIALQAQAVALEEKNVALQAKAEQEGRSASRLRRYIYALVFLALLGTATSVGAVVQSWRATSNQSRAVASEARAKVEEEKARAEKLAADEARRLAEDEAKKTEEQRLLAVEETKKAEQASKAAKDAEARALAEKKRAEAQVAIANRARDEAEKAVAMARLEKKRADILNEIVTLDRDKTEKELERVKKLNQTIELIAQKTAEVNLLDKPNKRDEKINVLIQLRDLNRDVENRAGEVSALTSLYREYQALGEEAQKRGAGEEAGKNFEKANSFFGEAKVLLQGKVTAREALGEKGEAAEAYEELGRFYNDTGKVEEATQAYEMAFALQAEVLKDDDFEGQLLFDRLSESLSQLYGAKGPAGDAKLEELYRKKLARKQQVFENEDPGEIYVSLNELGDFYLKRGKGGEAVAQYTQSLEIVRRVIAQSPDDEDLQSFLVKGLNQLGDAYKAQGDLAKAEEHYRLAIAHEEKVTEWEEEEGIKGEALRKLTDLLRSQKKYDDAAKVYADQIEVYKADEKGNVDKLSRSLISLGNIYAEKKDYEKALKAFGQAVELIDKHGGEGERPLLAVSLRGLAKVKFESAKAVRPEESRRLKRESVADYTRALSVAPDQLGDQDGYSDEFFNNLPLESFDKETLPKLARIYEQILASKEKIINEGDAKEVRAQYYAFGNVLDRLKDIYRRQGDSEKLAALIERSLKVSEKRYAGKVNLAYWSGLRELGLLYSQQGKYDKAEKVYAEALTIGEQALGPQNSSYVVTSLQSLAAVYRGQKKYAEAVTLYERARFNLDENNEEDSPRMLSTLINYVDVLKLLGRTAEAMRLQKDVDKLRRKLGGGASASASAPPTDSRPPSVP